MFKKKRASSNPPNKSLQSTTPSATSAAALAFLNKRTSDANLSSAAAAAALRSHTASPEPVGAIQTKRMIRRGSTSSYGSPQAIVQQPVTSGVQRSGSVSSMTNRTFRSPSPSARNSVLRSTAPADVPPIPVKSHRRGPSAETTPLASSTATSPRLSLPVESQYAPVPSATVVRYDPNTRTLIRVPVQSTTAQNGATANSRSINFSRPMSPPLTQTTRPREPVRARPATAQGFTSPETLRSGTPVLPVSLRQKAVAMARSGAGAEAVPALVAASTAARTSPAAPLQATEKTIPTTNTSTTIAGTTTSLPATNLAQTAPPVTTAAPTAAPSAPATRSAPTPSSTISQQRSAAIPPPSSEQIKSFQTRAAAMLARPRTDALSVATPTIDKGPPSISQPLTASAQSTSIGASAPISSNVVEPQAPLVPVSQLTAPTNNNLSQSSHSPTRSAHFSQSPLLDSIKHQPPPRALSPAKSALKAPTPRESSPAGSTSKALSDTSDTRSEDGLSKRKKNSAHVSFDATPITVGEAASPSTPINTLTSPQYRKSLADPFPSDDEDHEYAPTPVLPSFGSVRGRKSPTPDRQPTPPPATMAPPVLAGPAPPVLAGPAPPVVIPEPPPIPSDPVRPELGARRTSDHADLGLLLAKAFLKEQSNDASVTSRDLPLQENIPDISVVPATPMPDQGDSPFAPKAVAIEPLQRGEEPIDINRPFQGRLIRGDMPTSSEVKIESADVDSDEQAEFFADAAETQPDTGADGGFASLAAIVESPRVVPGPQNPPADANVRDVTETNKANTSFGFGQSPSQYEGGDWDQIRQYWNSLSADRRQQLEREAAINNPGTMLAEDHSIVLDPLPPWPDQEYQRSVTTKSGPMLKQTMRSRHERSGSEPIPLRTSMRDSVRTLPVYNDPKAAPLTPQAPKSGFATSAASNANAAVLGSRETTAQKVVTKPKLERTLSNESSASESSFRRQRKSSVTSSEGGGFSMRRSMRGPPDGGANAVQTASSRKSDVKPRTAAANKPARTSMRASADSNVPTLRNSAFPQSEQRTSKRSSMLGFGKQSRSKRTSGFQSRFDDSSDEDGEAQPRFMSRFDSSGDDESSPKVASPLRTRRKKARRASVDSSDLEDINEDVGDTGTAAKAMPTTKLTGGRPSTPPNLNGTLQGTALHSGTLRSNARQGDSPGSPSQAGRAKRGFFGFGKKRDVNTNQGTSTSVPLNTTKPATEKGSGGRPTSKLFRRLSTASTGSATQLAPADTSPYAPPPIPKEYTKPQSSARPHTSAETPTSRVTGSQPPAAGVQQDNSLTAPMEQGPSIVSERTGKKKKFQGLRRFLRVND